MSVFIKSDFSEGISMSALVIVPVLVHPVICHIQLMRKTFDKLKF